MEKWTPPPGVFITGETAAEITIEADAAGVVTRKWLSRRSPNAAVNASAEELLKNLSRIPAHPGGPTKFSLSLVPD